MYHYVRGKLVDLQPTLAVVEAQGVGYELRIPLSTSEALRGREECLLYTSLVVRPDDWRMYGFATIAERQLFELVVSVSGIGPATALAALSSASVDDLVGALSLGETDVIRQIKGVGKRLADRMVLELRDRVGAVRVRGASRAEEKARAKGREDVDPEMARDAIKALLELGYGRREAEKRVASAGAELVRAALVEAAGTAGAAPVSVESLIRHALRSS